MIAAVRESYYSTTATVIPIFLFLMVFETRALNVRVRAGGKLWVIIDTFAMVVIVLFIFVGEAVSLIALASRSEPGNVLREVVGGALIFEVAGTGMMAMLMVLSPLLGDRTWYPGQRDEPDEPSEPKT